MKRIKLNPADVAFAKCVREAANHTCLRCGIRKPPTGTRGSDGMECSHVFSRRHRTIRWAKENAKCLCSAHHRWWHENPVDAAKWYESLVGESHLALLREKRDSMIKVSKDEEKLIAKHYRSELRKLEQRRKDGETGQLDFTSYQ